MASPVPSLVRDVSATPSETRVAGPRARSVAAVSLLLGALGPAGCGAETEETTTVPEAPSAVVFVDESAAPGGDGSLERPFRTLREALELQRPIEAVALAGGRYPAPSEWTFDEELTILPYREQTPIVEAEQAAGVISWHAPGVHLRLSQLRFASPLVLGGDDIALEQIEVSEVPAPALVLDHATTVAFGVDVRNVTATEGTSPVGDGVVVDGGSLDWTGGSVTAVPDRAVVLQGCQARLSFLELSSGSRAPLTVIEQADVSASDVEIGDVSVGVFVSDATLLLERSSVHDAGTAGLLASAGAATTVRDSTFADCPNGHLSVIGEGSSLTAEGNTLLRASYGPCVFVSSTDGVVVVRSNTVQTCAGNGIALSTVTDAIVDDNVVSDILPDPIFPELADGIGVMDSSAHVGGNRIYDTQGYGFSGNWSSVDLVGNEIGPTQSAAVALVDEAAAPSAVTDNDITEAVGVGIIVLSTEATVSSNRITGTLYQPADGFGDGIAFGMGASVSVLDNTVSGSARNGVIFLDGATGSVEGNTLTNNVYYGIFEVCSDPANDVTIADNAYAENGLGDESLCAGP